MTATLHHPRRSKKLKGPIRRTPLNALGFLGAGALATVAVLAIAAFLYISQSAYQAGHQSTPTSAVNGFLDAALNDRYMSTMDKYLCGDTARRQAQTLLNQIDDVQADGSSVDFYWQNTHVTQRPNDNRATVTASVTATVTTDGKFVNNSPHTWRFHLQDRAGWKICSFTTS